VTLENISKKCSVFKVQATSGKFSDGLLIGLNTIKLCCCLAGVLFDCVYFVFQKYSGVNRFLKKDFYFFCGIYFAKKCVVMGGWFTTRMRIPFMESI
jgi:hypothetical protein